MNILLLSLNFYPELTGIGKYSGDFAFHLAHGSNKVDVISSPPYYPHWNLDSFDDGLLFKKEELRDVTVYRCPLFVPRKITTVKRLLHLFSFSVSSALRLLSLLTKKYDYIIVVQPTFFCVPMALLYSKITGAKSILHIQDYELDAMLGLGMGRESHLIKFCRRLESWLMKKFDYVSTISYSMIDKAKQKGVLSDRIRYLPNWADVDSIRPDIDGSKFKQSLGFSESDFIVLYSGNIGKKQGLEIVLRAAKLSQSNSNIKFLLVGEGAHVQELKTLAAELEIINLTFLPLQAWGDVPSMLAMADIHLVIQKRGAADSVLPSKLTNILAVGGYAIVTAEENTELGLIHSKFPGIYNLIEPENEFLLFEAIVSSYANSDRARYNSVARDYAEKYLIKDSIIDNFLESL